MSQLKFIKPEASCGGCPLYEAPYGKKEGFSYPDGLIKSGVAIIAEALGKDEEIEGKALVGKSGLSLFQQLSRIGLERDQFRMMNTLSCRPPDNKLLGTPWQQGAIECCTPILDERIEEARRMAEANGKNFTIVTLGVVPFKRIMGLGDKDPLLKIDYYAYPFWSDRYKCWVFNAPHPAYLVRGKTHLWTVIQFVFQRAVEVAANGLRLEEPNYLLDPTAAGFEQWVDRTLGDYERDSSLVLSYDIETPYKRKADEAELGKEEDGEAIDHTILRISFCSKPGEAVSIPWSAEYLGSVERLFTSGMGLLGWNSDLYDKPRVSKWVEMRGPSIDGMVAWHVLNTSLPKGLGFVTPFYNQTVSAWKHMSDSSPAFYNAKDADMALRNYMGIVNDLKENKLWHVFDRHVLKLNEALAYMSNKGVKRDNVMRQEAEDKLSGLMDGIEAEMEAAVPVEARKLKVFKKTPTKVEGLLQVDGTIKVAKCPGCGLAPVKADHFRSIGKKALSTCVTCGKSQKKHPEDSDHEFTPSTENPCFGLKSEKVDSPAKLWAEPQKFKVSKVSLMGYQKSLKHQAILNRKEGKVTFDEDAIVKLMKRYPSDRLYPDILKHREVGKLLSTYVGVTTADGKIRGGLPVGKDSRIRTSYSHNPSTLRLASQEPNLQNLPRPDAKNKDALANIIRNLVVADEGNILGAVDYGGIEAVLTGYFAMDPQYIRLAKKDVHTFYTVHSIHALDGRIRAADLPDLGWPDDRLFPYLEELKKAYKSERNNLYKHLVHAANFMQSPKGAQEKIFSETRIEYPIKTVAKVMDVYFELFPSIRRLHRILLEEAEKEGFLRNPFGYVHRFNSVHEWKKEFGEWTKKPGPDANKVVAFKAQSTAAAMIKEAIIRLYFDRFEEAGQFLRLQIHDEILWECPTDYNTEMMRIVMEEMGKPVPEMPLPKSWGMGDYLSVNVEGKSGFRWGEME